VHETIAVLAGGMVMLVLRFGDMALRIMAKKWGVTEKQE
jgi:hypothetical protein